MLSCESDFRESFATMGRTQISTDARPSASTSAPGMTRRYPRNKEIIHSGHFMVSEFEAEAQDDEENVAIPVPDESEVKISVRPPPRKAARPSEPSVEIVEPACAMEVAEAAPNRPVMERRNSFTVAIDSSLTKLFQCMSLAYRQKLTSPKWNRFKGLKLRWKDKIRLNNIIWRAWHMQFIKRRSVAVCQFASPLDVDIHIKPEAVVLEGKYWKRKLAAVTAEYKKWRIYFRNNILRKIGQYDDSDLSEIQLDGADWSGGFRCLPGVGLSGGIEHLMDDVDLLMDFNDTLFSTLLPNQPFFFPNPREIAREAGIADFIQPGLVQLQPNLDDFMDTLEPLQDLLNARLPSVPEEVTLHGPSGSSNMTNASASAGPSNSMTIVCPPSDNQPVLYTEMTPLVAVPSSGAGSADGSLKCGEMTITAVASGSGKPMTVSYNQLMNVADDGGVVEGQVGPSTISGQSSSLVYAFVDGKEFAVRTTRSEVAGQVNIDPSTGYPVRVISTTANLGEPTILCNMGHIKHEALSPTSLSPGMQPTAAMSVSPTPSALSPNSCSPSSTSPLGGSGFGGFRPRRTVFSSSQPLGTQAASKNLAFERQQQQMHQQQQAIPTDNRDHDSHQMQTSSAQITSINVPENVGQGGLKSSQDEDVQQASIPVYHVTPAVPIGAPVDRRHGEVAEPMPEMTFPASTSLPSSGAFGGFVPTKGKHASGPAGFAAASAVEWGRQQQQQQQQLTHPQQQQQHQQLHHALTRGNQQAQPVGPRHMGRSPQQELPQVANQDVQQPMRSYPASPKATGMGGGRFTPPAGVPTGGAVRGFQPRVAGGSPSHHHANQQQQQQQQTFGLRSNAGREFDSGMGAGGSTMGMGNVNAYASPNVIAQTAQAVPTTSVSSRKISPGSNVPPFYSAGSPSSHHGGMASAGLKSPTTPPAVSPPAMSLSHLSGAKRNSDGNVTFEPSGTGYQKDHRRVNHINAEHKRRCNIKNGFDTLQQLVPSLQQQAGGAKVSKAAMLHKAADLIKQLKQERQESQSEVESLKAQIESISRDISVCQSQLPDTGAPVIRHKTSKVTDMYSEYVKQKTLQDWKFWVFSLIANPMAESFSTNVSTGSFEDMCRTTLSWGEQNCSLVTMRPSVLGSLRHLSTNTSILSNPAKLPEEAARAVTKVEPAADGHLTRPGTLSHQSSTSSCSSMS